MIPYICNDFINNFLPLKCNIMDKQMAIDMTVHLCMWLYNRKFTQTKLE